MRTVIMSLACAMLFFGIISWAEELSEKLNPPAVDKTASVDDQRNACKNNMRLIEVAKILWVLENGKTNGATVDINDLVKGEYLPEVLKCPSGGQYKYKVIGEKCQCSIHGSAPESLLRNEPMQSIASEQFGKNIALLRYSVQADEEVPYEVNLDGKLVSSGKALIKQYCYLSLPVTPGDHVLTVTASGYETWQKTVTLLEGSKNGQNFLIELKKSTSDSPSIANSVPKSGDNTISFLCRVQAETEISYEIHIDGKIVGSGSMIANPKDKMTHILSATPGNHVLTVTAPGYETWQKTITLSADSKTGQNILAEMNKSAK